MLSDVISNVPDVGKSVDRSIVISLIIVIMSPAVAPLPPRVTVPPAPNS